MLFFREVVFFELPTADENLFSFSDIEHYLDNVCGVDILATF
jgi:hypothetical protein